MRRLLVDLQIYSSLVLQQVVPGPLRGRVFAFEQTITTVCNVASRVQCPHPASICGTCGCC